MIGDVLTGIEDGREIAVWRLSPGVNVGDPREVSFRKLADLMFKLHVASFDGRAQCLLVSGSAHMLLLHPLPVELPDLDDLDAWTDPRPCPESIAAMCMDRRIAVLVDYRLEGHVIAGWSLLDGALWRIGFTDSAILGTKLPDVPTAPRG